MALVSLIALAVAAANPAPTPVGEAIFHYIRSNRDGSQPEHVVHFRPTRTGIAVYKWVEKCTTAAYVTAEMNADLRDGRQFIAGKVAPDGTQASFGTLTVDTVPPALVVDITPPGGERIQTRHPLKSQPFIIYDFDLADLNAFLQEQRPAEGFTYELPVVWPSDDGLFRDLGKLSAKIIGTESRLGRPTRKFALSVDGPTRSTGTLWVDADKGFIVEADLGLPNHLEYRDFLLKLERIELGGQAAWDALTRSHYASCPTGN